MLSESLNCFRVEKTWTSIEHLLAWVKGSSRENNELMGQFTKSHQTCPSLKASESCLARSASTHRTSITKISIQRVNE